MLGGFRIGFGLGLRNSILGSGSGFGFKGSFLGSGSGLGFSGSFLGSGAFEVGGGFEGGSSGGALFKGLSGPLGFWLS